VNIQPNFPQSLAAVVDLCESREQNTLNFLNSSQRKPGWSIRFLQHRKTSRNILGAPKNKETNDRATHQVGKETEKRHQDSYSLQENMNRNQKHEISKHLTSCLPQINLTRQSSKARNQRQPHPTLRNCNVEIPNRFPSRQSF